jgi:transposase InsO family protein
MARLLEVSERTIRRWVEQYVSGVPPRRPGRPAHSEKAKGEAVVAVLREMRRQGFSTGSPTIYRSLDRRVSLRLVRYAVKLLKEWQRRKDRARTERNRLSIEVELRDAVWCLDAMHLGREEDGKEITGQVLRDIGTLRDLAVTVGRPVTGDEVIALLERIRAERGTLPLVLMTDNGSAYTDGELKEYLERHQVLHLLNLPRTPQHNPYAEQAVRELKEDSGLGKGVVTSPASAAVRLAASRHRLDECRLRPSLGYRTSRVCDEETESWYDRGVRREEVYESACRAVQEALEGEESGRARRKKERWMILATVASFEVLRLTRGGEPLLVEKPDTIT